MGVMIDSLNPYSLKVDRDYPEFGFVKGDSLIVDPREKSGPIVAVGSRFEKNVGQPCDGDVKALVREFN